MKQVKFNNLKTENNGIRTVYRRLDPNNKKLILRDESKDYAWFDKPKAEVPKVIEPQAEQKAEPAKSSYCVIL